MKRPGLSILAALAVAVALGAVAPAAQAATTDVNAFDFESFSGHYYLDTDASGLATTRVVETIVARFPETDQNRGIVRAIPLADGEYPLEVTMLSVTDGSGEPVYYERNDYDGFAEFALGTDEFVHGRTVYVLEYTMKNTIRHFADTGDDEFYWDINGNGWAQSFDTVSAHIHLSEALAASLTGNASCYLGYYGDVGDCSLQATGDGFGVQLGPVGAYNTLTVAIGFDGGTAVQPQLPRDSWIVQLAPRLLLGAAGALVVLAILLRLLLWRDARGRGTIIAQFEPPEGEGMLLGANLIGRRASGLSAQFVDFAVRGIVNVIDTRPGSALGLDRTRFELELVDSRDATAQELKVLVVLFGAALTPGERINPGQLDSTAGAALYALPATTAALAVSSGYRAEPKGRWSIVFRRITFWLVLAFIPIWIWAALFDVLGGAVLGPAFGTIALAIAMSIILVKPALLTARGAESRDYLLGLREYLTVAEEERMRMLQSPEGALRLNANDRGAVVRLNERLLGYAVLWGVEDQWVQKLRADLDGQVPTWLQGGSFDTSMMRSFTTASVSSVRPVVTSSSGGGGSWSSSGGSSFSSGSSGGGFSGGGGGGGGGGGR